MMNVSFPVSLHVSITTFFQATGLDRPFKDLVPSMARAKGGAMRAWQLRRPFCFWPGNDEDLHVLIPITFDTEIDVAQLLLLLPQGVRNKVFARLDPRVAEWFEHRADSTSASVQGDQNEAN